MQNKEIFYEAGLFKWQTREVSDQGLPEYRAMSTREYLAAAYERGRRIREMLL